MRPSGLSLRTRLLAGMAVVAVVLVAVALLVTTTTSGHLVAQVDDRLEAADRTRPGRPAAPSDDGGPGEGAGDVSTAVAGEDGGRADYRDRDRREFEGCVCGSRR